MELLDLNIDEEICMRTLVEADASALHTAMQASSKELMKIESWYDNSFGIDATEKLCALQQTAWLDDVEYTFAIVSRQTDILLGTASLNGIRHADRIGNIGYWVTTPETGKNIASRAARRIARFGFEQLALSRLEIVSQTGNIASRRIAYKIGARFEGIARNRLVFRSEFLDAAIYSLIASDLAPTENTAESGPVPCPAPACGSIPAGLDA